jgi:hypothetical protein
MRLRPAPRGEQPKDAQAGNSAHLASMPSNRARLAAYRLGLAY